MAHPTYKDSTGLTRSRKGNGAAGTDGAPDVFYEIIQAIVTGAMPDLGVPTDVAVAGDGDGNLSQRLRQLNKRWDLDVPVGRGQKAMTASFSVCLASDQSALQIAAGANAIGSVKDNGPANAPSPIVLDNVAGAGTVDLTAAPGAGLKICIDDLTISVDTTCRVTLIEETSLVVRGSWFLLANTPFPMCCMKDGIRCVVADKKMRIKTSVAANLSATGGYHSE